MEYSAINNAVTSKAKINVLWNSFLSGQFQKMSQNVDFSLLRQTMTHDPSLNRSFFRILAHYAVYFSQINSHKMVFMI